MENVSVSATENAVKTPAELIGAAEDYINELIEGRQKWESGTLKASLEELYELLAKCVGFYEIMSRDDEDGERLRKELDGYCKEHKLKFKGETHTIVKIVRAVFDNDRRRYAEYGKALKIALQQGKKKTEIVAFLRKNNGIDGVIKSVTTAAPETIETRATKVWEKMKAAKLATVSSDALKQESDQAHINKPVVLLATQLANGEFAVHKIVKKSTAVNSTYALFFKDEEHAKVKVSAEAELVKRNVDRELIRKQLALAAA